MNEQPIGAQHVPPFSREFFTSGDPCSRIGSGRFGGKAQGLIMMRDLLRVRASDEFGDDGVHLSVPTMVVVTTDIFDEFMEQNDLYRIALSNAPDDRIAHAFQHADMPTEVVGDLQGLIEHVHQPLAIRSSSLLEDALYRPFAGVYATKMTPNNEPDPTERFRRLLEAIKFVYASTFFRAAKNYIRATNADIRDEKMAVIIQEVVGNRHGDRFYPEVSGVARSYNFYPMGRAKPREGVVSLALGLGKTIVDGDVTWSYSPAHPKAPPPFGSTHDLLQNTQLSFWAVNMGHVDEYDPIAEHEFLSRADLSIAEYDGVLPHVASTYDPRSDRLTPGTGGNGPRVLTFAPLLVFREYKFNSAIRRLISICEQAVDAPVEIEFALTFPRRGEPPIARLGFLQVRPMVVSDETVDIEDAEVESDRLIIWSDRVMGNGVVEDVRDVVYVRPEAFEAKFTRKIAYELESVNTELLATETPYVLIGFGRWGSSDPWLGIPVDWGFICGARVIVEATLPTMIVEPSQGSHFFHNISRFRVSYFSVDHKTRPGIRWDALDKRPALHETDYLRHVQFETPLSIRVDGRTGHGGVWLPETE
ncbi:MAG: PEP/pyruvate-binding domain-containing protein [Planctomycetota bacterium]